MVGEWLGDSRRVIMDGSGDLLSPEDVDLAEEFLTENLAATDVMLDSSSNVVSSQWSGSGIEADVSEGDSPDYVRSRRIVVSDLSPTYPVANDLLITIVDMTMAEEEGPAPTPSQPDAASPPDATVEPVSASSSSSSVGGSDAASAASSSTVVSNAASTTASSASVAAVAVSASISTVVVAPSTTVVVAEDPDTLVISVGVDESLDSSPSSSSIAAPAPAALPPPSVSAPISGGRGAVPKPSGVGQPKPSSSSAASWEPMGPPRVRSDSVSSSSSTSSTVSFNTNKRFQDEWEAAIAGIDVFACPPPPDLAIARNMTPAEARATIAKWEVEGFGIPLEFMPLFWLRSAGACNFAIKSKAISAMYTGWHVSYLKEK